MTTPQNQPTDFKTLFEAHYKGVSLKEGNMVKGTVVAIQRDITLIDVGFKSEGVIPLEEFRDFDGKISIKPGDEIDVVVEQLEGPEGHMILSKERADAMRSWDRVADAHRDGMPIDGVIVNKIKGGMSVNLGGIKAFLPASQIDLKPVKSLDKLIGQKCQFKILKLNAAKGNIVLSRRVVLEEQREVQKRDLLENLKEGQILSGVVKNITDYGAFIDLGGIDGLLHITDVSWGRISHPSEVLKVGDVVEVAVLKYERETEKVSLGLKQLKGDPWADVEEKFRPGERITGKVVNATDYGLFVELAEGVEGLVHISDLTWNKKIKQASKLAKAGDMVEVVILDVDGKNRRVSLGMKQLAPSPWIALQEKYPAGTKIKGVVRNITDFGLFVGIEGEDIDGLVHISDLSWEKKVGHPSELYQKGAEVEAVVLSVDATNERFSLGIKQLTQDPWGEAKVKYPPGSAISGIISELDPKGVLVVIDGSIVGHVANAELSAHIGKEARDHLKVGDAVTAQVKKFDDKSHRFILSIKAHEKVSEKEDLKDFMKKQGSASVRLKDAVKG